MLNNPRQLSKPLQSEGYRPPVEGMPVIVLIVGTSLAMSAGIAVAMYWLHAFLGGAV